MKKKEIPLEPVTDLVTPAQRKAKEEGEERRKAYILTLDPRQRADLDYCLVTETFLDDRRPSGPKVK